MINIPKNRRSSWNCMALAAGTALCLSFAMPATSRADDADAILKAMSNYLAGQKSIAFTYDTSIEIVTPFSQKVQFDSSGEASVMRPDKIKVHRVGGYADVELWADGKSLTLFGKHANKYAQTDTKGSIDEIIDQLRSRSGRDLPAADLLSANPYAALSENVIEARHIGQGVIDGVECEHFAFRNAETDWQLWVQTGDKPIPRKYVITSKTVGEAPQYTIHFKDWKTDVSFAPDDFAFKPPQGAERVEVENLPHLDEVPESAPLGDRQ